LTENQVRAQRTKIGFQASQFDIVRQDEVKAVLKRAGHESLYSELCEGGLGEELYTVLKR